MKQLLEKLALAALLACVPAAASAQSDEETTPAGDAAETETTDADDSIFEFSLGYVYEEMQTPSRYLGKFKRDRNGIWRRESVLRHGFHMSLRPLRELRVNYSFSGGYYMNNHESDYELDHYLASHRTGLDFIPDLRDLTTEYVEPYVGAGWIHYIYELEIKGADNDALIGRNRRHDSFYAGLGVWTGIRWGGTKSHAFMAGVRNQLDYHTGSKFDFGRYGEINYDSGFDYRLTLEVGLNFTALQGLSSSPARERRRAEAPATQRPVRSSFAVVGPASHPEPTTTAGASDIVEPAPDSVSVMPGFEEPTTTARASRYDETAVAAGDDRRSYRSRTRDRRNICTNCLPAMCLGSSRYDEPVDDDRYN